MAAENSSAGYFGKRRKAPNNSGAFEIGSNPFLFAPGRRAAARSPRLPPFPVVDSSRLNSGVLPPSESPLLQNGISSNLWSEMAPVLPVFLLITAS